MIRHFVRMDGRRLKANRFSDMAEAQFAFDDDTFMKHTLVDEHDDVLAIVFFQSYWNRNYMAFFLVSEDITPRASVELKNFIWQAILDLRADRVHTVSMDDPVISKWHEWLAFTCEGHHAKMVKDRDYCTWAVVRGRDY